MQLELLQEEIVSAHSLRFRVGLPRKDFQLFAYLLDSVNNLGVHSCSDRPEEMQIVLPRDLRSEWLEFVVSYREFIG